VLDFEFKLAIRSRTVDILCKHFLDGYNTGRSTNSQQLAKVF
jgi:hypothetical protein